MEGNKERNNRLAGVFGYSRRLGTASVLVLNYVWQQEHKETLESQIVEAALRQQLMPRLVLSFGAGAGLTKESPKYRFNFGFQRSL